MRRIVIGLVIIALFTVATRPATAQDQIRDLVVKIHAVQQAPDLLRPWARNSPQQVKGSGVVIDGRRILTNAHVVRYASQIYVQPNQSASHIPARVEAMTAGMDLAILKLDDETFFENRGALPFAQELPRVKDSINVYGYPTGGTELSVTQGIVLDGLNQIVSLRLAVVNAVFNIAEEMLNFFDGNQIADVLRILYETKYQANQSAVGNRRPAAIAEIQRGVDLDA